MLPAIPLSPSCYDCYSPGFELAGPPTQHALLLPRFLSLSVLGMDSWTSSMGGKRFITEQHSYSSYTTCFIWRIFGGRGSSKIMFNPIVQVIIKLSLINPPASAFKVQRLQLWAITSGFYPHLFCSSVCEARGQFGVSLSLSVLFFFF